MWLHIREDRVERCSGRDLLVALKQTTAGDGPVLKLVVGHPPIAVLRPLPSRGEHLLDGDVERLTQWRNDHVRSFLTEFVASRERTRKWLVSAVGPRDDKILFMLDDVSGQTFGYMGLDFIDWAAGYGEADAIVKGGAAPKGTMFQCLRLLLLWAHRQLGLEQLGVRVRSDNPAVDFYKKLGFAEEKRVALEAGLVDGETHWQQIPSNRPDESPISLVHMRLDMKKLAA